MLFIEFMIFFMEWVGERLERCAADSEETFNIGVALRLMKRYHTNSLIFYMDSGTGLMEERNFERAYRYIVRSWKVGSSVNIYWSGRRSDVYILLEDDDASPGYLESVGIHEVGSLFKSQPYGLIIKAMIDFHRDRVKLGLED